ncbi:hypothetical protein [Sutterella sp.]|uniref:phage tail terminator protein n=1 Tax=Sutterella sp. TaxID=1981025 RepID=UPI0026E07D24|nr:hypothetical protein [Sutterella sp.]MDO5531422.1 hypothetical protein [Sutterella sp.]
MELTPIITALRERCPSFGNRVAGAAEWGSIADEQCPILPAAYVVPASQTAGEQTTDGSYLQTVTCTFAVITIVDNSAVAPEDAAGLVPHEVMHALEREIFKALLGWRQGEHEVTNRFGRKCMAYTAGPIAYEGGELIHLDAARLIWQSDFSFDVDLGEEDTYLKVIQDGLPDLEGVDVTISKPETSSSTDAAADELDVTVQLEQP